MEEKDGSKAMPRRPASPSAKMGEMVANEAARRVPFARMIRMLPLSFSVKKIRPSGANLRDTGKLRPVRTGVTGDVVAWACDKKCGAIKSSSTQAILAIEMGVRRILAR